jgi:raffinose/stachyose/melibiose transport system permease protein
MANKSLTVSRSVYPLASRSRLVNRALDSFSLLALVVLLVIMLFPVVMVTTNSFKTEAEYYANGPLSLPQSFNLDSIIIMWNRMDYTIKLWNSFFISVLTALLALGISLFNAFALGIGRVKGATFFLIFFLLAITLPQEVLAYPLYYFFKLVKLYDTRFSIILTLAVLHSAFGTYLLTSVFNAFPKELIEAALIDGCNKLQLLFRIVVPISMPSLSVLFVFFFIWTWNEFFLPLIFLVSNDNQTIPIAMALARGERGMAVTTQSAAAFLGVVPCIIFFFLFQRTLTKGITAGSIK